jgi:hypothetical protein
VLAAEHLLGLAGVDGFGKILEAAGKIVGHRLASLSPLHQDCEILGATLERFAQIAIFFKTPATLKQLLRGRLVLPEVGRGYALFD